MSDSTGPPEQPIHTAAERAARQAAAQQGTAIGDRQQRVLIYRSDLLPPSETFVVAQAAALARFTPIFAGMRRPANSLSLTARQLLPSRFERPLFLRTGHAPLWLGRARRCGAALIHAHFALDAAEALQLVHALGLPLLVTLHGYDVMRDDQSHALTTRGRLYLAARQQLWDTACLFVCVSDAVRRRAIERGFPACKLYTLPIGIDTEALLPSKTLVLEPRVLFVGRLVEKKGCAVLLEAMARVQQKLPAARLVLVGDGPERLPLEEAAARLTRGTRFLGVQSPLEVRALMQTSRCLAAPSITAADGDAEGLPTVLAEAMALGLPVVSTHHSGIGELITHGVEGLLAPERDGLCLAHHLLQLLTDDSLADRLREAARLRVERAFHLGRQTSLLEQLYDEAVAAHSPPLGLRASNARGPQGSAWERVRAIALRESTPRRVSGLAGATETHPAPPRAPEPTTPAALHPGVGRLRCPPPLAITSRDGPPQRNDIARPGFAARDVGELASRDVPHSSVYPLDAIASRRDSSQRDTQPQAVASRKPSPSTAAPAPPAIAESRLRHQAAWMFSGNGVAILCQGLYFLLIGRLLGAHAYGAFVGMVALVNVLSQFSSCGMEMVLLRTLSRTPSSFAVVWARALVVTAVGFLALLVGVVGLGHFFLPPLLGQLLPWLALSDALFGKLTQLSSRALQGSGHTGAGAALPAMANAVRAVAAAALFAWGMAHPARVTLLAWAQTYTLASLLVALVGLALVTRLLGRPRLTPIRRAHLAEGLSFSFSSSAISVYNDIDKTMLVAYGMLSSAGIYAAAYRVIDVASTPILSLFAAASPRLFRQGARSGAAGASQGASRLLRWTIPFGLAAAAGLSLAAPLLPRLFGHSFAGSTSALRWLCLLPLLRGLHYAWGTAITACTSQWRRTAAQASSAVLNLLLNLWLIPRWGWQGAAAASLLTDGALAGASFLILRGLVRREAGGVSASTTGSASSLLAQQAGSIPKSGSSPLQCAD